MTRLHTLKPTVQVLETRRTQPEPKVVDAFYTSAPWREARAVCLLLKGYRCVKCNAQPRRLFVDHIVELKDGGSALDQGNLEPLCGSCHTAKTARERAARQVR